MPEVISPPVHVLDYGYQAPNPIQWSQAGAEVVQPITQAIAAGNEARNRFLLSQVENQRAMELAKWQHSAQLQREQMRDERMIQVARLRAQQQMEDLKEKGALDDIKSKNAYLQRIGGGSLSRQVLADGHQESDTDFGSRIDAAIKARMENNIQTDAKAAYSIQKQIAGYNTYLNDPRVNNAVGGELNQAVANPGVQAQARNLVDTGLSVWLNKVAPDNATVIQDAIDKAGPQNRDLILQRAGLKDAFDAYQNSALQQSAYAYLKATGSPAAKQVATASENLSILKQQLQDISMMPGDNGRMVPKSWWSQVQNTTDDMLLHDRLAAGPNGARPTQPPATAPASPPSPVANPVDPVTVHKDPYADYRINGALVLPGTPAGAAAAQPVVIPNPHPITPITAADATRWGVTLPQPAPAPAPPPNPIMLNYSPRFSDGSPSSIPFVMATTPAPPAVMQAATVPVATNNVVPPAPTLQAIPSAVKLDAPIPSNPVVFPMRDDTPNPYDPALQMMQMRNFYAP